MLRTLTVTLIISLALCAAAPAQICNNTTDSFWKNDTIPQVPSGTTTVSIIQGLCEGEAAASVYYLPSGMGPQQLTRVSVGFGHVTGGSGFTALANVEIYDGISWSGNKPTLGPKVFDYSNDLSANLQLVSHGINELDLEPYNVVVGNQPGNAFVIAFRIGFNPNGSCSSGFPANFFTDNATSDFVCDALPQVNLMDIQGQGWVDAKTATIGGIPLCPLYYDGNWVIRACSKDAGAPPVCQPNMGLQGPGSVDLSICGQPLSPGNSADFLITGMAPSASIFIFGSPGFSPFFIPESFGVLGPNPPKVLAVLPSDSAGQLFLPNAVPGGTGVPFTYYIQAISTDPSQPMGYAHSNCLQVQFQ